MNGADSLALDVANRLFAAIEAGDIEAVRGCYAPQARIWHNFDGIEQSVEDNLKTLGWLVGHLDDRRYEVRRRDIVAGAIWQHHVLVGTVRATGAAFAMAAAMLLTVDGGKITRIDEYLDPAAARALTG